MTAVMVDIQPITALGGGSEGGPDDDGPGNDTDGTDTPDVEFIGDMNKFFEHNMCSCSASDDNPY